MIIDCARVIELKINTKKKERDAIPFEFLLVILQEEEERNIK